MKVLYCGLQFDVLPPNPIPSIVDPILQDGCGRSRLPGFMVQVFGCLKLDFLADPKLPTLKKHYTKKHQTRKLLDLES